MMNRRNFVKAFSLGALAAPFGLRGMQFQAIGGQLFQTSVSAEDRVLILIRLNGGNDGLNMVIPLDGYDNLMIQRPRIMIPGDRILRLTDGLGLHPSMTGMRSLFDSGKLSIVQGVGYPDQNRSHFRSMDIWSTGSLSSSTTTGWLGRDLDVEYPNFPEAYPDAANPDPFAISMGYEVSATCQGLMGNFSHALTDPFETMNLDPASILNDGTYYGDHMEYLSTIILQSNAYGAQINDAANAGQTLSSLYNLNDDFAVQLRHVARLISGGLKTKIYILNINDFDTHDGQVDQTNPTIGLHAELMKKLSDGITAFQQDLQLLGLENRVAGMTYSEFGRQIADNASYGTDHGDAAPLILFGPCITNPVLGENPVIGNQIVSQAAVPMQIDFRDVYASVLRDWFEVPEDQIQPLFEHQVTYHDLLNSCNPGKQHAENTSLLYPNPCVDQIVLRLDTGDEQVRIELFDMNGRRVAVIQDGSMSAGRRHIPIPVNNLAEGHYLMRVTKESGSQTLKFLRVREN